ncbi:GGDEF domain-containing protein [Paenibacillus hexagrammi]|uniref:GGDEF domain-containing protein n=1 Tax=Paenibacillus hexagrammi TaxID=2908839 RepID=A0ABY3SMH9_9BACL|nr:GGDEF domain-containing protein [Paenibacillus sp. YPD9-1]UJF34167.1 GGDEF domain-containing protein [Paenibacillus sp. YPD9-1]
MAAPASTFFILTGTAIGAIFTITNPLVHGIEYILMLPLLISLFYFNKRYLLFSLILNCLLFIAVVQLSERHHQNVSLFDLLAFIFIMIGAYFVVLGALSRGLILISDLTKTIQSEQELLVRTVVMDKLSKTDALTDLYNHKTFHEYLDKLVEHSEDSDMPLHLAIMDIDNFKSINDTFGHATGDVVLKRVAAVISESISSSEIVARYGGEEFAIIFTEKALHDSYTEVETIRESIHQMDFDEMDGRKVSVSIGLSSYQKGSSKSKLFQESDQLLYQAKRSGKNRTVMDDSASILA